MNVRPATESDLETLKELWLAFDREHPSPEYEDVDEAVELSEVEQYVREHVALLAENGDVAAGFVLARMRGARHGWISDLYVSPDFRQAGAAGRLVREAAAMLCERGADVIELDVRPWNEEARVVYERWGFRESKLTLAVNAARPRDAAIARGAGAVPRAGVRADGRRDARRQGCRGIRATAGRSRVPKSTPRPTAG